MYPVVLFVVDIFCSSLNPNSFLWCSPFSTVKDCLYSEKGVFFLTMVLRIKPSPCCFVRKFHF
jgi:hypothetical protein